MAAGNSKKRRELFLKQNGECFYCFRQMVMVPMSRPGDPRLCTIDELIPVSRGGHRIISNQVACCSRCNGRKHMLTAVEFLLMIAFTENEQRLVGIAKSANSKLHYAHECAIKTGMTRHVARRSGATHHPVDSTKAPYRSWDNQAIAAAYEAARARWEASKPRSAEEPSELAAPSSPCIG